MLNEKQRKLLRLIPAVHELVQHPEVQASATDSLSKEFLTTICQESIQEVRSAILRGHKHEESNFSQDLLSIIKGKINSLIQPSLRPLINGTGIILHTNLGRAKLSAAAQAALTQVASSYSNLEFNIEEGTRGSRHSLVEELICRLTGAEAALVCNNNAAAVFLVLRQFAQEREVIVSRGEMVEIGGSFRVSEIMRESGAYLVEVGTTNKTHFSDYEKAITEQTGMIMKVHTSNFIIKGFTAAVDREELVQLAQQHSLLLFEDLGSGVLYDLRAHNIGAEPTVQEVLQAGIDLVSFSGDKLLGGPQAGIIAGKREYIDQLKKNQLMRSLRVDKFTLAALQATLKAYLQPEQAVKTIPTLQMILQTETEIKAKAELFLSKINQDAYTCRLLQVESEIGGGTMPEVTLPSWGVEIKSQLDSSIAAFSKRLRSSAYPLIGRIYQDRFILDFRTITEDEIKYILEIL